MSDGRRSGGWRMRETDTACQTARRSTRGETRREMWGSRDGREGGRMALRGRKSARQPEKRAASKGVERRGEGRAERRGAWRGERRQPVGKIVPGVAVSRASVRGMGLGSLRACQEENAERRIYPASSSTAAQTRASSSVAGLHCRPHLTNSPPCRPHLTRRQTTPGVCRKREEEVPRRGCHLQSRALGAIAVVTGRTGSARGALWWLRGTG